MRALALMVTVALCFASSATPAAEKNPGREIVIDLFGPDKDKDATLDQLNEQFRIASESNEKVLEKAMAKLVEEGQKVRQQWATEGRRSCIVTADSEEQVSTIYCMPAEEARVEYEKNASARSFLVTDDSILYVIVRRIMNSKDPVQAATDFNLVSLVRSGTRALASK